MSKIIKIKLLESGHTFLQHEYNIYKNNNKFFLEYNPIGSFNIKKNLVEIEENEFDKIVNHLLKYYKILSWKDYYSNSEYVVMDGAEWHLEVYTKEGIIKSITGINAFPKNYNSFRNYIKNKTEGTI